MIIGIGNDITAVDRIRGAGAVMDSHLNRVLGEDEQAYCLVHDPSERMAGRWAAKEACLKALQLDS